MFEYETGMDTRVGFPNEHLAKESRSDLESPMYATAVGLVMKGIEFNELNQRKRNTISKERIENGITDPPNKWESDTSKVKIEESYFDKWATKLLKILANEK